MTETQINLWKKIENFQIDDPSVSFSFYKRLARENGWSQAYAERVIKEYKFFIFMCCISEHGVTPSDPVDQAWHLHLTYTKSYWIDFCKNTLGKDIHHNPTKGGEAEAEKFNVFYTTSLSLYKAIFGTTPPSDIWHNHKTRFTDIHFQRVNLSKYWLLRKPALSKATIGVVPFLLLALCFIQAEGESAFIVIGIVVLILAIVFAAVRNQKNDDQNNSSGNASGCSTAGCSIPYVNDGDSGCSGCSGSGCSGCGSD
jgi:hypothetical protein